MTTTSKPQFSRRETRPGYRVSFDGRTRGFVTYSEGSLRGNGSGLWNARRADGTRVGIFSTRAEAAEALRPAH